VTDEKDEAQDGAAPEEGKVVHLDFKKKPEGGGGGSDPEKLAAFTELIARGKTMVTLDARREGARIPAKLKEEMQLNLDFSHRFAGVYDFEYDERGVRSTLTFGGQPFFCDIPWGAVWAMRSRVDNQMLFWPEDLPEEMLAMFPDAQLILKAKQEEQAQRREEQAQQRRPREVPPAEDAGAPPPEPEPRQDTKDDAPDGGDDPGPKRPGLRLVKGDR
jgi:stringent starvation protein B